MLRRRRHATGLDDEIEFTLTAHPGIDQLVRSVGESAEINAGTPGGRLRAQRPSEVVHLLIGEVTKREQVSQRGACI